MSASQTAQRGGLASGFAFVAGVVFAVGLALAGMTQPSKVLAFLDIAGDWDPSLAFVMGGAIAVYFTANQLVKRLRAPLACASFQLPTRRDIDAKLLVGAGVFGIGWGLGGYCPGPGITSLGSGAPSAVVFVLSMALGMFVYEQASRRFGGSKPAAAPAPEAPSAQGYTDIEPAELARWNSARLVDVRERAEFEGPLGHLAGATLVPLATLEAEAQAWDKTTPVVVICRSGRRSALGAGQLVQLGFTQVLNLRGGMEGYRAQKLPV